MTEPLQRQRCPDCGRIVYERGPAHMIEAARLPDGSAPADEFLAMLEESKGELRRRLADVAIRFEDYAWRGTLRVPRELNDLADGIREIKAGNVRLPFFELDNSPAGTIRLTHGFSRRAGPRRRNIFAGLYGCGGRTRSHENSL